jgi:hypothetical protein
LGFSPLAELDVNSKYRLDIAGNARYAIDYRELLSEK